ncbi:hypothetical protein P175DRAFT_0523268 [Aspergillus ochraceoroseus IBT 24754]|uniref:CENP-V/GFA domain-containing protein n=3 Tax=Aspergillus subgen. Nidulantes TaxID=2720870 RepID=A0A2T5M0P3_9EURO|nr:uncharacterized protein P175DRAFT_0523268 [Aspergillus ochraceoroseus IBT 24754]PTU22104.1 hypothetical protein P175DRAFT_0523268 [Aspergillus ochraceoroseus IBT 24754]
MPTGSCLCQAIRYEYKAEPIAKALCHCVTCRKISSGSTVNVMVPRDHFHITSGSPKVFTITHETGMKLSMYFCENCGITIYKTADSEELKGNAIILAGTLDDSEAFSHLNPEVEFFTKDRASWLPKLQNAEQKVEFK